MISDIYWIGFALTLAWVGLQMGNKVKLTVEGDLTKSEKTLVSIFIQAFYALVAALLWPAFWFLVLFYPLKG